MENCLVSCTYVVYMYFMNVELFLRVINHLTPGAGSTQASHLNTTFYFGMILKSGLKSSHIAIKWWFHLDMSPADALN